MQSLSFDIGRRCAWEASNAPAPEQNNCQLFPSFLLNLPKQLSTSAPASQTPSMETSDTRRQKRDMKLPAFHMTLRDKKEPAKKKHK